MMQTFHALADVAAPTVRPAVVVRADSGEVWVRFAAATAGPDGAAARIAVCDARARVPGAEVLVLTGDDGGHYVIGVLGEPAKSAAPEKAVELRDGSRAEVRETTAGEVIRILAPDGRIVVEYEASARGARVIAAGGPLELQSAASDVVFRAAGEIRMEARRVELDGSESAALRAGRGRTAIQADPGELRLASERLRAAAGRADFSCGETSVEGNSFTGTIGRARFATKRLELVAETVIQKSRNVYRKVEKLAQLTAGRVRTLVAGTHSTRAGKVTLDSRDDVKIRGDQIHIG